MQEYQINILCSVILREEAKVSRRKKDINERYIFVIS